MSASPDPVGVTHVPSPRQKVVAPALVPLPRFVTGRFPVTPVERGSPVAFVSTPDAGVPNAGVMSVGLLLSTTNPVPVSSEITPANCTDVVEANCERGLVVRASPPPPPPLPHAADATAKAPELSVWTQRVPLPPSPERVRLVPVAAPILGVVNVGLVPKTKAPVPVFVREIADARFVLVGVARNVATPVPSPLTPVEMGSPVALVRVPDAGVPSAPLTK